MSHETSPRTTPSIPESGLAGVPSPSGNGDKTSPNPARPGGRQSRLPRPAGIARGRKSIVFGVMILSAAIVLIGLWKSGSLFARQRYSGPTWTVRKEKLKLTIVARGNLEAVNNNDIKCEVRSGTKGSTVSTTIKWLVEEGTEVKKGDLLMVLDSSGLQEQLKDKTKDVDKAYADKVAADEGVRIQEIGNESAVEAAKNARDLAKIELEKYVKGDYVAALKDIDGKIVTTKSDLEDWKDRAAWSARMVKKGLLSKVQADADKSRAEASQITLDNYDVQKQVLEKYTQKREIQDRTAKLAEAERGIRKAEIEARSNLAQKVAAKKTAESIYQSELARKEDLEAQIAKCTIRSPQDGLVVYFVPEQVRGGGGSQQSVVAQGEPVREGQKMIQIPDLSKMLVTVKVPEAFVSNLKNPDAHDKNAPRQKAQIKVDSFSKDLLTGHVKSVDTVASTQDWFASDVKVYKTKVSIHESLPGLKPGMSAEVTILAEESPEEVLVVPVQAVLGTISAGAERKCFVVVPGGEPELRDIVVGKSNERVVAITSGLNEGEQVVLNPTPLLKEGSELRPGKQKTKSEDHPGYGGGGRPEGGKGGGGGPKGPKGGGPKGPAGKGPAGTGGDKGYGGGPPGS
jgi:RND family efflux transporter MFP subunit